MIVYIVAGIAGALAVLGASLIYFPAGILTAAVLLGAVAWFAERELERGQK